VYDENSGHRPAPRIFADTREIYGVKYFSSRNTIRGRVLNILDRSCTRGLEGGEYWPGVYATFAILPPRSTDNNRASRISLITNEGRSAVGLPFWRSRLAPDKR